MKKYKFSKLKKIFAGAAMTALVLAMPCRYPESGAFKSFAEETEPIEIVISDSPKEDKETHDNSVSIELIDAVESEEGGAAAGISMDFSYGFQNVAKSGRMLPFYVDINNKGSNDIEGQLIIEVNGSVEADRNEFENAGISYCFDANVPAGGSSRIQNTISLAEKNNAVSLRLVDKDGKMLCERETNVTLQQTAGSELLIGILSKSAQELEYFKNISIAGTQLRTRTVELEAEKLPESASGLEQLDMIIVSDYDIDKISADGLEAIRIWLENGGILLIGTGHDGTAASRLCSGLVSELSIGTPAERAVNMGIEYSKANPDDAVLRLSVCDVFAADGIQVMQSDDIAMLTTLTAGNGIVGIAAYDLCDISSFCSEELEYADDLLKALIGSSRLTQLINSAKNNNRLYEQADSLVGLADPDRLPNAMLYILFCIAYLCLIAGIYFYLRIRGLSIFYHAFVPIASFMSAIILWLLSSGLHIEGISFDYAVIRELHDGYVIDDGFMKISSASLKDYRLEIPAEFELYPIVHEAGGELPGGDRTPRAIPELRNIAAENNFSETQITLSSSDTKANISASGMKPFAGIISEYSFKTASSEFDGIETNISIFEDEAEGSIDNNTKYDLEDAALIMYGRVIRLGNIKAGASVKLDGHELMEYPIGDSEGFAEEITGVRSETEGTNAHVRKLRRARLLDYYISNSLCGYFSGVRLIAFADGVSIAGDISSDSHIESHGSLLISTRVNADFTRGRKHFVSCVSTEPKLVSGEYDAARNLTGGSCVLEYTLGNDINIEDLSFRRLEEAFEDERTAAFSGGIYFYNYQTSSYDAMGEAVYTGIDAEALSSYLSPSNTITVRFTADDTGGAEKLYLPVPYAVGTERR